MKRIQDDLDSDRKSIALVGPSGHLKGLGLGARIDSYDLVARVNEFGPSENLVDYGCRTDIVFHNFMPGTLDSIADEAGEYAERAKNPVQIICPRRLSEVGEEFSDLQKLTNRLPKGFTVEMIDIEDFFDSMSLPPKPTTGFYSILWSFSVSARSFICGFSFYSSRVTYHPEKHLNRVRNGLPRINVSGHDTRTEVEFLREFLKEGDYECDDVFREIIAGKYKGKYWPLFILQVARNTSRGLLGRFSRLSKIFSPRGVD